MVNSCHAVLSRAATQLITLRKGFSVIMWCLRSQAVISSASSASISACMDRSVSFARQLPSRPSRICTSSTALTKLSAQLRCLLCLRNQAATGLSMPCKDVVGCLICPPAGETDSRITQTAAMEPQAVQTWAAGPRASSLSRRTASSSGGGGPNCASRAGGVRTCTFASCKDGTQPRSVHSSSPGA